MARRIAGLMLALAALMLLGSCTPAQALVSKLAVPPPPETYEAQPEMFSYYRSRLTPQEQYLYDLLYAALKAQEPEIGELYPDTDMIQRAVRAIDRDHPELFWFEGTGQIETTLMGETPVSAVYQPDYGCGVEARPNIQALLDQWEADCFAALPPEASDYDKVLRVYTYLIDHADYAQVDTNSILNIMLDGRGLCGCYAKTAQYLLTRLGVDCTYVSGTAGGEVHAWNLVWPDGQPCWMDPTWGDPVFEGGQSGDGSSFDYFCVTTADLTRTHMVDGTVPVPDCTTEDYNYYRRNGLYFAQYDPGAIVSAMEAAIAADSPRLCLRFGDDIYPSALQRLFGPPGSGEVHELLRRANADLGTNLTLGLPVWYSRNDAMGTIAMTIPY